LAVLISDDFCGREWVDAHLSGPAITMITSIGVCSKDRTSRRCFGLKFTPERLV